MCAKTTCGTCKKATWSGCGQHIDQALKGVPKAERCRCRAEASKARPEAASSKGGGFLSRLFGGE